MEESGKVDFCEVFLLVSYGKRQGVIGEKKGYWMEHLCY